MKQNLYWRLAEYFDFTIKASEARAHIDCTVCVQDRTFDINSGRSLKNHYISNDSEARAPSKIMAHAIRKYSLESEMSEVLFALRLNTFCLRLLF